MTSNTWTTEMPALPQHRQQEGGAAASPVLCANQVSGLFANDRMAYDVAGSTPYPEWPEVTIADLGILREVQLTPSTLTVTITPAHTGSLVVCAISADITLRLRQAGFTGVSVRIQLVPAWSSNWITSEGRRKLAAAEFSGGLGVIPWRS
jgi:metal-sulfur cluster biosynthetic enzyme